MHWFSVLAFLTPVPVCLATAIVPRWDHMRVKHSWGSIPAKWNHHANPPAGATIDLHVALKPHQDNALIDTLYEVSDPKHPKYGAHLSKEQVADLVAPHSDTLDLVGSWLAHHELPSSSISITHGGSWLTLSGVPVAQANALLGASYQFYRHTETGETVLRTISYALPEDLHHHVQTVAPTTYFGSPRALRQTSQLRPDGPTLPDGDPELQKELAPLSPDSPVPANCSNIITPTCLRTLYKTRGYVPQVQGKNQLGIVGYLEEYVSRSDLKEFMIRFRPDAVGSQVSIVNVSGSNDENRPGVEANLDIQYTESITYPTPNIYYSTEGSPPFIPDSTTTTDTNEPYLDWLNFILDQPTIPQTISTSYGDDEQTVPLDYAMTVCKLFAQLGTRGSSILFSSGDFGVGGGSCLSDEGTDQFTPVFPASCPFVTSVGGTTKVNPEVAADLSGGGFSNYFSRPDYQNTAVSAYLKSIGGMYSDLYNSSGRGYPDISAQAMNYQIVLNNTVLAVDGTSCAAPTAAGIISLLNDFLISQGRAPLGFLNPWIYSDGSTGFNDITSGSNPGCNTTGFPAMEGWDPVTGLGTPDFLNLQSLLKRGYRYGYSTTETDGS